jgi:predicted nucleotidyltransferase
MPRESILPSVLEKGTIVPDMRTQVRQNMPSDALWPSVRRAVLALMLMNSDQEWHLREIVRRTGTALSATQRELLALTEAGILLRRVESRRSYYRANPDCPIFPDLRQIMLKTVGLADVVREALKQVEGIRLAFIFGSMAKGTADAKSDVDVLIVGDGSFADVSAALLAAQERLGREITPTTYSPEEFSERLKAKHHFLMRVLKEPKIMLVGVSDDIERMGGITPG